MMVVLLLFASRLLPAVVTLFYPFSFWVFYTLKQIMDGFDTKKTVVPYFKNPPKKLDSCMKYEMVVDAHRVHGEGTFFYYYDKTVEVRTMAYNLSSFFALSILCL